MDRGNIFFCILGFPVSQNVKKRVFTRKNSRLYSFNEEFQNELLYNYFSSLKITCSKSSKFLKNMLTLALQNPGIWILVMRLQAISIFIKKYIFFFYLNNIIFINILIKNSKNSFI